MNLNQTLVSTCLRSHYVFDLEQSNIASAVTYQFASRIFMIDIFKHLHHDFGDLLSSVLIGYPGAKARALGVVIEIRPADQD